MPTVITKTVKSSGGDYTSLSGAEAGEQKDLVAADEQLDIECYAMEDTTRAYIDGWTTDSTRYIRIFTPAAERHDGKWNTSKYRLVVNSGWSGFFDAMDLRENYTRVDGLQFSAEPDTSNNDRGAVQTQSCGGIRFSNNVVRTVPNGGTGYYGATLAFSDAPSYAWNNVIYLTGGTPVTGSFGLVHGTSNFDHVAYLYNNTVYGWATGFPASGGNAPVIKNNIANGNTVDYADTYDASSVTNISEDATSPNAAFRNLAVTFVDEAGFDFHLSGSDTAAKDAGTDLSADANLPFSTDIDGATRSGTWDIGADEITATGRTTHNTRSHPLGIRSGINFRVTGSAA